MKTICLVAIAAWTLAAWEIAHGAVLCTLLEDVPATSIGGTPGRGCHYLAPNGTDFWVWIPGHADKSLPACLQQIVEN